MLLKEYGEKEFIKNVLGKYAVTAKVNDFDDCVIIDLSKYTHDGNSPYIVYSIDHPSMIIRSDMSEKENYEFYGRWAAACTCGDVLAMGAKPIGFSFDLSAPEDIEIENLECILSGIKTTLDSYDTTFEGGNFDCNNLETVCMAWGMVDKNKIIKRSGARQGDIIIATCDLGLGWAYHLTEKKNILESFDNDFLGRKKLYKKYPAAPYQVMQEVFENNFVTSGMDLTDGLIEFLYTVSERNLLGVEINFDDLCPNKDIKTVGEFLNIDPRYFMFDPGYDTPVVHGWTVSENSLESVLEIFHKYNAPYTLIGKVTDTRKIMLKKADKTIEIPKFWDDQLDKTNILLRWEKLIKSLL